MSIPVIKPTKIERIVNEDGSIDVRVHVPRISMSKKLDGQPSTEVCDG